MSMENETAKYNEALGENQGRHDDDDGGGGGDDDGWGSEDSDKYITGDREFLTLKQRKSLGISKLEPLMNLSEENGEGEKKNKKKAKEKPTWKPPTGGVQVMMLPPKLHHRKRNKKKLDTNVLNAPGIEPMSRTRRVLDRAQKQRWRRVSLGSEGECM
jgi:hypothetical protein